MTTRFIITSDLHQQIAKWRDLVRVVEQERPRFGLVAGDLLPKADGFNGQRKFFPVLADYLGAMRSSGENTVLTFFGNDDFHPLEPLLDDLAAKGLCVNLNGKVHREDGLVFCGMNQVRDYPFGYKHWCAPDGDFITSPVQFCGEGLTLDAQGRWLELPNLRDHLLAKPSLHDRLEALRSQLTPDEVRRSIWLVHCPPAELGMDICHDGRQVGSPTVLRFIHDAQPLLGCSGHIHESPYQPGGKWAARVGRTLWFQPGQEDQKLHHVSLEVTSTLGIESIEHSILGSLAG
jgi:Icc-related predicted phosphoesterase